ncbi:uncharacterized protein LOC134701669 [Mytilus trossulus]|uniref:uncharacterized protein LOC134701669 n=1 Tax=Mytilus trossulus TaxID=6551 RepID=UPI003003EF21
MAGLNMCMSVCVTAQQENTLLIRVQITTNLSTNGNVDSMHPADIMNYTIDVNRYSLDLNGITSLVLEINTCTWARVLLSSSGVRNSSEPFYDIVFINNNFDYFFLYIAYRTDDSEKYKYKRFVHQIEMNCTMYLPFWISWAGGDIIFGTGINVSANVLGNVTNTNNFEVRSIGVFTHGHEERNWKIQIEVSDKFAGYFDSCSMDNTKSDMVVVGEIKCSEMRCATSCGMSKTCMGYNFNSAMNRCELLWFGSDVVTDIPHHTEAGWKFYSKCFNGKTACLGCYF